MNEDTIRGLPGFQKQADDLKMFRELEHAVRHNPLFRLFLSVSGVDPAGFEPTFAELDALEQQFEQMVGFLDPFNDLFGPRGWIVYDHLSQEVIKQAVLKGREGDMDGAEALLVEEHDAARVRRKLKTMRAVRAFRPRLPLAHKAHEDYAAGRYHACVPVVLALLDGMVNELHEGRRSFFSEEADLTAWDSVAAHSKGLMTLAGLFKKGRRKTTTEPLTLPYRHGIMHGMDLGYDNRLVAAKTWAALFAARDWAVKAETDLLEAPPEEPEPTPLERFQSLQESIQTGEAIKAWEPRDLVFGEDLPATGEPEAYREGTPERVLVTFLTSWRRKNYGAMAACMSVNIQKYTPKRELFAELKARCGAKLLAFRLERFDREAPGWVEFAVTLTLEVDGAEVTAPFTFTLVSETPEGKTSFEGDPHATWGLGWWSDVGRAQGDP